MGRRRNLYSKVDTSVHSGSIRVEVRLDIPGKASRAEVETALARAVRNMQTQIAGHYPYPGEQEPGTLAS